MAFVDGVELLSLIQFEWIIFLMHINHKFYKNNKLLYLFNTLKSFFQLIHKKGNSYRGNNAY